MGKVFRYSCAVIVFWAVTVASSHAQSAPCDCVTTGNCPVPITDNGTFQGTLDVTVNGPNDLGQCPLTSVCFSITHTWVGDLSVTLTSPNGTNYLVMADQNNNFGGCGNSADNVDVCIVPGTANPLTNNTQYVCNSGPCQSGTCCLVGNWTMPCGGVTDPVSGAVQSPNCNLNDFNLPGAPANGTWTLTVNDICGQDVGFLNNFSLTFECGTLSCTVCNADGGSLNAAPVASCYGDPSLNLNLTPQYSGVPPPNPAEYGYAYVLSQNSIITAIIPTPNLTSYPPGSYQVCGISYFNEAQSQLQSLIGLNLQMVQDMLNSTTAPFCADLSNDCVSVLIGPAIPPTPLPIEVCAGQCVFVGGVEFCQSGSVTMSSWLGCDSVINVIVIPIPLSFNTITDTVCQGECVTHNNQLYCPPGPHVFTLENWKGCDSIITLNFLEIITSAFINPPLPPPLSCTLTSVTLDGSLSVPSNAVYSWSGPGNFTSNQPSITVSTPGEYTLTVINNAKNPPCTSSTYVTVTGNMNGPNIQVLGSPPEICAGEGFDLASLDIVDSNNNNPTITFHTGLPATTANQLQNTYVTPASTTTYYVLATSGSCTDTEPVTLTVKAIPTADFTLTSPICVDSFTTVTFTGTAGPNAIYNWNFGGGTATPGTGPGPHTVEWVTSGSKTITLTISDEGCNSIPQSHTVEVNSEIPPPVINCSPQTSSITFTWNTIPGASGYLVNVAIGPEGVMINDTTYEISGLSPGEQVSIFVEAISGNACGNTVTQITCTAQDCPPISVNIEPVAPICLDGTAQPIQLTATQTGGVGDGVYTFQGAGVNPITGVFNPVTAGPGAHTIVVTYEEGTCLYNASRVINVFPQPTADFTATSPLCLTAASTVNYTGNASSTANFSWNFDGGVATPGAGPGPHSVEWPASGDRSISLVVEEDGCASDTAVQIVQVAAPLPPPVITCVSTTQSIEFFWNTLPGGNGFTVNVISGGTGTPTSDTSMLFSGLMPGDAVTIEVVAHDDGPCPDVLTKQTCIAQNCPDVFITIDSVPGICLDTHAVAFDLQATVTGGTGLGTLVWSGNGIVNAATGTFDPQQAGLGANTITATYEEDHCVFTQNIIIQVYAQPLASFIADTSVCVGEASKITYTGTIEAGLTLDWNFGTAMANPGTGQGPHNLIWSSSGAQPVSVRATSSQGCISEIFTDTIQVEDPLTTPEITCITTTSSIQFNWPDVVDATSYVAIATPGFGSQTSQNSYFVDGLVPNDSITLQLTISNNGPCPPVVVTKTCIAKDCPLITVSIEPVAPLCIGAASPVQLVPIIAGGAGTGTGTWSGPGVDALTGVFNPALAGLGQHKIGYTYEEENCTYEASVTIVIFSEPSADFTATDKICITDEATISYTGDASSTANFAWNFDGGTAVPGIGAGPHSVSWAAPGIYNVSLTVEQDGCTSTASTHSVQVDPELEAPLISCTTTTTSVQFNWPVVANATNYDAEVIAGAEGTQTSDNSYFVDGLTPGDQVTLQLTISGNTACPPVVVTQTCTAQDCPPLTIGITPVPPICLEPLTPAYDLEVSVSGGGTTGVGTWSGPGITDSTAGTFNPTVAGVGTHEVFFTYLENNCTYDSSIQILVGPAPYADAGTSAVLTCKEDETEVTLGGSTSSAGPTIIYDWDADFGSFPGDSTLLHPVVSVPGTYTLTVTDTFLHCQSSDVVVIYASQDIPVPTISITPISCFGENDGSISVTSVSGGLSPYLFSLNGSPFSKDGTFSRLSAGTFELTVLDAAGCENTIPINIIEPEEVSVELIVYLEGDNVIYLGDSLQLEALLTLSADSLDVIAWQPDSLLSCSDCVRPVAHPLQTTTFSVYVESKGCSDSDQATIFVRKEHPVFVPNAFSPNGDGINDKFLIFAGSQVAKIKAFLIFNRWGEVVHEFYNFQPNDPTAGWDGTYRRQLLNPGVFTWFAEIEFIDGVVEIFEGDVTLMQ